jgi:hypothetical protein
LTQKWPINFHELNWIRKKTLFRTSKLVTDQIIEQAHKKPSEVYETILANDPGMNHRPASFLLPSVSRSQ